MTRVQGTLKLFNQKVGSVKNQKVVLQRIFHYFLEMYFLNSFLINDAIELAQFKDYLAKELYNSYKGLEVKESQIDMLNQKIKIQQQSLSIQCDKSKQLEDSLNMSKHESLGLNESLMRYQTTNKKLTSDLKEKSSALERLSEEVKGYKKDQAGMMAKMQKVAELGRVYTDIEDLLANI